MPTITYVALANLTLSATTATVTFNGISQAYRDLVLVSNVAGTTAGSATYLRFNGDSTGNYSKVLAYGDGTNVAQNAQSGSIYLSNGSVAQSADFDYTEVSNIMDYSVTDKHKNVLTRITSNNSSGFAGALVMVGRWNSTAAINSITVGLGAYSFIAGSTFSLYGIVS